MDALIENTPAAWTERANTAATSYQAALWSEHGQRERFDAVVYALDPQPGETLLDFGCGTGGLSELLPDGVKYVGYDWSHGMVDRARREHSGPGRLFCVSAAHLTADVTACVGTFNLADRWSNTRTWETISTLWEGTRRALAASLLHAKVPGCLFYTPAEIAGAALWITRRHSGWYEIGWTRRNDLLLTLRR